VTTADDKTLDRIRKLLAKAEGTTNEHERQTFMDVAQRLMAKYGIDRARLGHLHPGSDTPGRRVIVAYHPWANEQLRLMYGVAEAVRCKCIRLSGGRGGTDPKIEVFGYDSDMERAELLYTSLLVQMFSGLNRQPIPEGHRRPRAFRHAWLVGFADEAARRIKEAEQRAVHEVQQEETSGSTALVLLERGQVVHRMFAQAYPKVRNAKSKVDAAGLYSGREAGARADIGGARLNSPSRPQIR
jgi:hypothetical protein